MTVLEDSLQTYLLATAGITGLVSTRVYGMKIQQGSTFPCITKQRISTPRILTHNSVGATGDLASPRFQIDCWGTTEASAKAVTDAVRAALNGKTGSLGSGRVSINAALVQEEAVEYDTESELYRGRCEYKIWHKE